MPTGTRPPIGLPRRNPTHCGAGVTADVSELTIDELAPMIEGQSLSARELTDACLQRIDERDGEINAFITVDAAGARAAAAHADDDTAAGRYRGPLHGIPISVKDLIDVVGMPTTAASKVRPRDAATRDAAVVRALKTAGAVILGKCNLHEFAFGTTGEDSAFGPTRNPYDTDRSPGGSSGGSAAAVATGMGVSSIGTDTGGSIRIPSAACGTVGLKPGYGELSVDGIVPLSGSLDHVGPLCRSVRDVWVVYRSMAGEACPARLDPVSTDRLRLAIPRGYFLDHVDPSVRATFDAALERLRASGTSVNDVSIAHADQIAAIYLHIVLSEGMAYHARTLDSRPADYTPGVRLRLEMGRYVLAEDYLRAQRGREILRHEVDAALDGCDALVLPTLAIPAPRLGSDEIEVDGLIDSVRGVTLRLTQAFNLTGHPAVSLPCGTTPDGLPCGLQLIGHAGRTGELLRVALAVEAHIR